MTVKPVHDCDDPAAARAGRASFTSPRCSDVVLLLLLLSGLLAICSHIKGFSSFQ
jgi:hypothetical protein